MSICRFLLSIFIINNFFLSLYQVSWTHALRTIVKNCYKHHGREDLLPEFGDDKNGDLPAQQVTIQAGGHQQATLLPSHTVVQTINNPDGTVSLIQVDTGNTVATLTADVAVSVLGVAKMSCI